MFSGLSLLRWSWFFGKYQAKWQIKSGFCYVEPSLHYENKWEWFLYRNFWHLWYVDLVHSLCSLKVWVYIPEDSPWQMRELGKQGSPSLSPCWKIARCNPCDSLEVFSSTELQFAIDWTRWIIVFPSPPLISAFYLPMLIMSFAWGWQEWLTGQELLASNTPGQ